MYFSGIVALNFLKVLQKAITTAFHNNCWSLINLMTAFDFIREFNNQINLYNLISLYTAIYDNNIRPKYLNHKCK